MGKWLLKTIGTTAQGRAELFAALNEVIALSEDIALVDQARRYRSDL